MAKKQFTIESRSDFDYTERELSGKLRDAEQELEGLRNSHTLFDDRARFYAETARVQGRCYTYRTQLASLWSEHGHWTKVDASTQTFAVWQAEQELAREREAVRTAYTTDEDIKAREERDAIGLRNAETAESAAADRAVEARRKALSGKSKNELLQIFSSHVRIHSLTTRDSRTEIVLAILDQERGSIRNHAIRCYIAEQARVLQDLRNELGA